MPQWDDNDPRWANAPPEVQRQIQRETQAPGSPSLADIMYEQAPGIYAENTPGPGSRGPGRGPIDPRQAKEETSGIVRQIARRWEATLVHTYEKTSGRALTPENRARFLDYLDQAAQAQGTGDASPTQARLLRDAGFEVANARALKAVGPANQMTFIKEITRRQGMEPMARVADWSENAGSIWNPNLQDTQGNPIPPARGRQITMSPEDRQAFDQLAQDRVTRRGEGEPYTRLAPEPRPYQPRRPNVPLEPDPAISAQFPTWDEQGVPTLSQRAFLQAQDEINQAHDPFIEPKTSGGLAKAMSAEHQNREPYYQNLHKESNAAGLQGMYRDQTVSDLIAQNEADTPRARQLGRPPTYDELSPDERRWYRQQPEMQQALRDERARGQNLSQQRRINMGNFRDENKDFNTRGDIPSPQAQPARDIGNPQTRLAPEEDPGPLLDQMAQHRGEIQAALDRGDEAGAIRALEAHDNLQARLPLPVDEYGPHLLEGMVSPDTRVQHDMNREFMDTVTNQSRFRGPDPTDVSMMHANPQPLSEADDALSRLMSSLDPEQGGWKGPYIDRSPDAAGNAGMANPRYRRLQPDAFRELVPAGEDPWDLQSAEVAPLRTPAFEASAGHERQFNGFPGSHREPILTPDQPTPLTSPLRPLNPAFEGPPASELPGIPSSGPTTQALEPGAMLGVRGYTPSPDPVPMAPDFYGTRTRNPMFDDLITNLQRGRQATGDFFTQGSGIGPKLTKGFGTGMTAFGLAGDVLDSANMGEFFNYLQKNGMDQDPAALTLGSLGSLPVIGPLIFNRDKFMNDPAYQQSWRAPLAVS